MMDRSIRLKTEFEKRLDQSRSREPPPTWSPELSPEEAKQRQEEIERGVIPF